MKHININQELLNEIRKRYTGHVRLASKLVDLLGIEREAVYRRLRGDVPFSFNEVAALSESFGISIDNLISCRSDKTRHFELRFIEYSNPMEEDFNLLRQLVEILRVAHNDPASEICIASNGIPEPLYIDHPYIYKYHLIKWMYLYDPQSNLMKFDEVEPCATMKQVQQDFVEECKQVKYCTIICDYMIFQYMINDIKYFESIHLLTRENVENLKKDMQDMLDRIEQYAMSGTFGNGNQLHMYISGINFDTNYCYISTENYKISIIKAFMLNSISSDDAVNFDRFKKWINSYKRLSTLISESGERQRTQFIDKQREYIDQL